MNIEVKIINAFSIDGTGGNPAGVVFDADDLTNKQKQAIATKVSLPETAFVSQSGIAHYKLEFFTPSRQIAHCGHATIATFNYLRSSGRITSTESSKETIDGTRKIFFEGDAAFMEQSPPSFISVTDGEEVLASMGINDHALDNRYNMVVANTGNSFLLIPLKDERYLTSLTPSWKRIAEISERYGCIGYYAFFRRSGERFHAEARMFGPAYGIQEEAATGMAAGPLACLLRMNGLRDSEIQIGQGRLMSPSSPSGLRVKLWGREGVVENIHVGGGAFQSHTVKVNI